MVLYRLPQQLTGIPGLAGEVDMSAQQRACFVEVAERLLLRRATRAAAVLVLPDAMKVGGGERDLGPTVTLTEEKIATLEVKQ